MSATRIAMIAALSRNRVIGVDGKLPWYLPEDLRFFKRMTSGKPLIMGRATFDSIGRPLPNRLNLVVTRDPGFSHPGVRVCSSLTDALEAAEHQALLDGVEELMVIGGGQIYAQALGRASRLYLTEVDVEIEGDTFFPILDANEWEERERVEGSPDGGQPAYRFVTLRRCAPKVNE
ncbi:dihydrofolate reductase [Halotalea alkalilenta]|uniref:Dihydrofolate reductase n=1 Tax=Halotalea alkalilenta TaxID=376489 RepID=A0A172YIL2_9GAMM|nr:dihydrofolate reductase [Halotalea alkalilenta]ANF58895.1 diacylglycerol kinase [Halotalea alkalilenta]